MKTNFENAVKMLIEGRCESIGMFDGTVVYRILDGKLTTQRSPGIYRPATDFLGEWECIGYKPEMEEVETIYYAVVEPSDGHVVASTDCKSFAEEITTGNRQLVEVRIPYQRPVKEKVARRMEIPSTCVSLAESGLISGIDFKFYAEYEE